MRVFRQGFVKLRGRLGAQKWDTAIGVDRRCLSEVAHHAAET